MKPITFAEQNCVYAENQPEYVPLPVHKTADGTIISCWGLTFRERLRILWSGKMWFHVMTFNQPLQPQYPTLEYPFEQGAK